jgi:hypothetical protein
MCDVRNCMRLAPYYERELKNGKVITVCGFHSAELAIKEVSDKFNSIS